MARVAVISGLLARLRALFRSGEEKQLLLVCRGDAAQMDRLIAYEDKRRPGISRRLQCRAALDRYKHDH